MNNNDFLHRLPNRVIRELNLTFGQESVVLDTKSSVLSKFAVNAWR